MIFLLGSATEYDPRLSYESFIPFEEQLEALSTAVNQGKVRMIGVSNETPYGLMKFHQLADQCEQQALQNDSLISKETNNNSEINSVRRFHRIQTIQNCYNLLCRSSFDNGLSECCHHTNTALLAYSPLAMGLLTGKYHTHLHGDMMEDESSFRLYKYKGRYAEAEDRYCLQKPNLGSAIQQYVALAKKLNRSPVELALQFILSNPLTAAIVIGASSESQLDHIVHCMNKESLSDDELKQIHDIHTRYPNPAP